MKQILKYLKPYKLQLIIGPIAKLIEAVLELLLPTLVAIMIDRGLINNDKPLIIKLAILMIIMSIVGYLFSLVCQYNASVVASGFSSALRKSLFIKISKLSKIDLEKFSKSSLTNRLTGDVNQLELAIAMLIRLVVRAPFICVGAIIMTFVINFKLSLILVTASILFFIFVIVIIYFTLKLYKKYQQQFDKMALFVNEFISSIRLVKSYTREKKSALEFSEHSDKLLLASKKVLKISMLLSPITTVIMNIVIVLVLWFGGAFVTRGDIEIGSLIAYVNYVTQLVIALIVVTNLIIVYIKAYSSALRVSEVLSLEDETICSSDIKYNKNTAISLENASFKFDNKYILNNINLTINKSESVGIIGVMGSGKTTLVNLITGIYTPSSGNVFINNYNTKYTDKTICSKLLSVVAQHTMFLTGTVYDNLTIGNKNATKEFIDDAILKANALDIITNLENGYDEIIQKNAKNFSGGQKQRLSLARGYIKNADILIVDDALNALDCNTYKEVLNSLYNTFTTKIILSQRPSTIEKCDTLYKLENEQLFKITQKELSKLSI